MVQTWLSLNRVRIFHVDLFWMRFFQIRLDSPPEHASEESLYYDESFGGHQQAIRFSEFQKDQWFTLCNVNGREMYGF